MSIKGYQPAMPRLAQTWGDHDLDCEVSESERQRQSIHCDTRLRVGDIIADQRGRGPREIWIEHASGQKIAEANFKAQLVCPEGAKRVGPDSKTIRPAKR